jgi:uncharacterized membrane protein YsdA (DUF1294 family)
MANSSESSETVQDKTSEKADPKNISTSWLTLTNVIACLIIFGYGGFMIYMLGEVSASEGVWTRTAYLLAGYEALAFAAAGYLFGKEVHRQQAEKAEDRAKVAQKEADSAKDSANEAITKGYRITEAVKALAAAQPEKI